MAHPTPYFDLLEDGLVEEVITRIPRGEYFQQGWVALSASSRRLCTLVRRARMVDIAIDDDLDSVHRLLHLPPGRTYHNVTTLSVNNLESRSLEAWGRFTEALAAAAAVWPNLEEVNVNAALYTGRTEHFCNPGCLSGPLLALRHAPALRRLELVLHEPGSLMYVPVLTQLTQLSLTFYGGDSLITAPDQHRLLAGMTNLISLGLDGADVEVGAPCALPPNLTRLEVSFSPGGVGNWPVHLAGCKQLRELQLGAPWGEVPVHPTLLLRGVAAEQMTRLVKLEVRLTAFWDQEGDQQEVLAAVLAEVEGEEAAEGDDFSQLPLVIAGKVDGQGPYIWTAPPNMGALSGLQHIEVHDWWLVVTSEHHWRALGSCSSLKGLKGLHASVPPPAGLSVPKLQELWGTTSTSPGDTQALLGAFPALQTLHLTVVPSGPVPDQPPRAPAVVPQRLSAACFGFQWPSALASAAQQAPYVSAYCCPLWAALPGLRVLALQWPSRRPRQPYSRAFPEAYQRDTAARRLGAMHDEEGAPVLVEAGQLLPVVSGARQLQVLDLRMELDPSSRDQLVLGVQQALPGLTRLGTLDGAAGLAPATVAAMRPGLLHDLTAPNWQDDPYVNL